MAMPREYDEPKGFKGGWRSAIFIIFVEMAERFAYYGISGNMIIYLTKVIGQPVATAAKSVNSWNGVSSLALFIGAFFADSYFGRFKTTLVSTTIFLVGLILLTISTSAKIPHEIATTLFFVALYVTAIGDGCHKPCVQTFAADQFDEDTPEQKKTKSSFFNWWFFGIAMGANAAVLVVVYIQDNVSWTVGFTIPTVSVGLAILVFGVGSPTYRRERPVGSPFTRFIQVIVASFRKRRVKNMMDARGLCYDDSKLDGSGVDKSLAPTKQFRCLDKAMIIDDEDISNKTRNPWRLCSLNQVEETKLILRLLPIWACTFTYAIIVAQVHTFFIKQASTVDRSLGPKFQIPPASLQAIQGITLLFIVPAYDKLFIPAMRKLTGTPLGINTLQRIGLGLGFSIATIIVAALVERKRIDVARRYGILDNPKATVPMSVGWFLPQFVVMGVSDFFTYVGMQEIFYDQMPEGMRSMGSALTNGALGVGALMSSVVISVVQVVSSRWGDTWLVNNLNRAHLDRFYWVLAGLCALNLVVYVLVAKWFVWKTCEADQSEVV